MPYFEELERRAEEALQHELGQSGENENPSSSTKT